MIEAELPDGTVLEFPDDTPHEVVRQTARRRLGIQDAPAPAGALSREPEPTAQELETASRPARGVMTRGGRTLVVPDSELQTRDNFDAETQGEQRAPWTGEDGVLTNAPGALVAGTRRAVAGVRRMGAEEAISQRLSVLDANTGETPEGAVTGRVLPGALDRQRTLLAQDQSRLQDIVKDAERAAGDLKAVTPPNMNTGQQAVWSLVQSAPPTLVGIGVGILTRNPMLAMSIAGGGGSTIQAGSTYEEARAKGASHRTSAVAATIDGILEGVGESLPLAVALRPGTPIMARIYNTMMAEAGQEAATQAMQDFNAYLTYNPDITFKEAWQNLKVAALAGSMGGGLYGAAGAVVDAKRERALDLQPDKATDVLTGQTVDAGAAVEQQRAESTQPASSQDRTAMQRAFEDAQQRQQAMTPPAPPAQEAAPAPAAPEEQLAPEVGAEPLATDSSGNSEINAPSLGDQVKELSLARLRDAGWNTDWPFVPADLMNADFRDLIRKDPELSQEEKDKILSFAPGEEGDKRISGGTPSPAAPLDVKTAADIEAASARVNTEPTEAQKEAGNYAKGHIKLQGLDIAIENPKGSIRSGKNAAGVEWEVEMPAAYGYVKRTEGKDGDQVDVYLGPKPKSRNVFVVDQIDPVTGKFDEHKALVGFATEEEALATYEKAFSDGSAKSRIGAVNPMGMGEFRAWVKSGNTKKPLAYKYVSPAQKKANADRAKRAKTVDPSQDTLLTAVAKLGGIDIGSKLDITGDTKGNRRFAGIGSAFSPSGLGVDDMATQLAQYGYMTPQEMEDVDGGVQALRDKVREEYDGIKKHYSGAVAERQFEEEAEAAAKARQEAEEAANQAVSQVGDGWSKMTEDEKDAQLDDIFGADSRADQEPAAGDAQTGAQAGEGQAGQEVSTGKVAEPKSGSSLPKTGVPAVSGDLFVQLDDRRYPVSSLEEASTKFSQARDTAVSQGGGGSSATPNPLIVDANGKTIGYISYNGRVWPGLPKDWTSGTKPLYDNTAPRDPETEKVMDAIAAANQRGDSAEAQRIVAEWFGKEGRTLEGTATKEPQKLDGGFDPQKFDAERAARIKASRDAGNRHLNDYPAYVETMRGLNIYYVHDPKVRGTVRTVANTGEVVVNWLDQYSADKELATQRKDGKRDVWQSWLQPKDLKDYVVEKPARTDQIGDQHKARRAAQPAEQAPAQADDITGFVADLHQMARGRAVGILNRTMSFDGRVLPRHEGVRERVNAGATVVEAAEGRRLQRPDGAFLAEKDITTTAMDFAEYLISKREAPALELTGQTNAEIVADEQRKAAAEITAAAESLKKAADAVRETFALAPPAGTTAAQPLSSPKNQRDLLTAQNVGTSQQEPTAAGVKAETVDADSIGTLDDHAEFVNRLYDGATTPEELKARFERFIRSRDSLVAELSKLSKDDLIKRYGSISARKSDSKESLVKMAFRGLMGDFHIGQGISYNPMEKDGFEKAIRGKVESTTTADLSAYASRIAAQRSERQERIAGLKKAITNPETLEEFDTFVKMHKQGEAALTPEQLVRYDELLAKVGRERRAKEQERKATVQAAGVTVGAKIVETKHTRDNYDLFVVQLEKRVERDDYNRLNLAARKLGGWYSSFSKGGAVPGFQFKTRESAEAFQKLATEGDTAAVQEAVVERREERREEKQDNAVSRLREMADKLDESADESLGRDRLANTARRARMASSADAQANADKALAKTMRNLAAAIEDGTATNLGGLRTKAQIEMLDSMAKVAHYAAMRKADVRSEQWSEHPVTADEMQYAEFPEFSLSRSILRSVADQIKGKRGSMRVGQKWAAEAQRGNQDDDVSLRVDDVSVALDALKDEGQNGLGWQLRSTMDKYKRLRAMGIQTLPELRAALREFVQYRGQAPKTDRVKELERKLAGMGDGVGFDFFPTPKETAERVVEMADIQPGMRVLEPSGGKGNLADEVRAQQPDAVIEVVEQSSTLREILDAKGYTIAGSEFMEFNPEEKYDRIVMNPPFSNGLDADHVRHAYDLLKPGGRLVAITGEGIFFRQDRKAQEFRGWLHDVGGTEEKLPEGTFTDRREVRTTGVASRVVLIDKPGVAKPLASRRRAPTGEDNQASTAFTLLAENDDFFRYPPSEAKTLRDIVADIDPDLKVVEFDRGQISAGDYGRKVVKVFEIHGTPDGPIDMAEVVQNSDREVWINVAGYSEGGGGSAVYSAVANYAHNNGLTFIGDPNGLSAVALYRRTEAMLSSALKFGTTRHLEPHERQLDGERSIGVKPLAWKPGDDVFNLKSLLQAVYDNVEAKLPEIANIGYNFNNGTFEENGNPIGDERFVELSVAPGARAASAGRNTLKRAALAGSLLRQEGGEGWRRVLGSVLRQSREQLDPALQDILYSRGPANAGLSSSGMAMRDLQAVVDRVRRSHANLPPLRLMTSPARLDPAIPTEKALADFIAENMGADGIEGAFHDGTVYLFADNIADEARAEHVLVEHELFHYGIRGVFGRDVDPILNHIYMTNPVIREKAQAFREQHSIDSNVEAVEEILAEMPSAELVKVRGWDRFLMFVRDWLARNGFDRLAKLLNDHLQAKHGDQGAADLFVADMVRRSRQWARDGQQAPGTELWMGVTKMSDIAPVFYSELSRSLQNVKQESGTADQWKGIIRNLKGVKSDEIEWSGVNEWLDTQAGRVEKSDIASFLSQNGVRVEETMLGNEGESAATAEMDRLKVELDALGYDTFNDDHDEVFGVTERAAGKHFSDSESVVTVEGYSPLSALPQNVREKVYRLGELLEARDDVYGARDEDTTRYSQYTLPGGKNYRELLLTLPGSMRDEQAGWTLLDSTGKAIATRMDKGPLEARAFDIGGTVVPNVEQRPKNGFQSSHFDQPNILAHIRFDERTDAEGKRVLFVEEFQSDWAQKGKRSGFRRFDEPTFINFSTWATQRGIGKEEQDRLWKVRSGLQWAQWTAEMERINSGVPSAPFVGKTESWVALAMKRMIRYAADNGFDRIAWTTGEQQVERYDLSKRISRVTLERAMTKDGREYLGAFGLDGRRVINETIQPEKLADFIGKDAAEKLRAVAPNAAGVRELSGIDLRVGGEGMRTFYDKIVQNVARDLIKKLGGGNISTIQVDNIGTKMKVGQYVPSVDEMRRASSGLPVMVERQLDAVIRGVEAGRPFQEVMEAEGSITLAEALRVPFKDETVGGVQPGFDLTPAMRQKARSGLPMFSRTPVITENERAEAVNDAGKGLGSGRIEFIGDDVGDINAFQKYAVYPRTIAAFESDFTPVYRTAEDQFETRDRIASELGRMAESYFDLTDEERGRVDAVLELGRLKESVLAGKAMSMENTGQRARLSQPGDTVTLSDKEKSAYWAVRKMFDKALDMFQAQALRDFGIDPSLIKGDPREWLVNEAKKRSGKERDYYMAAADIADAIQDARRKGYIPFARFGDIVISVKDATGATLWVEKVETGAIERAVRGGSALERIPSVRDALAAVRERFAGQRVEIRAFKAPQSIPMEGDVKMADLDMLAEIAKVDNQQWEGIRDQLGKALQARGFRKHFLGSQNIPGYSTDFERGIADYIIGLAGYLSRRQHADLWESAIAGIDNRKPRLMEYAQRYRDYVNDPQEEWFRLRQAGFAMYIAGVPASAAVNLTQVPLMTAPYLAQFIGPQRVALELTRAYNDVTAMGSVSRGFDLFDPEKAPADVRAALQRSWDEGFFVPMETYDLMGKAYNRTPTQRKLSEAADDAVSAISIMFQGAERINRLVTYIASHRIARIPGVERSVLDTLAKNRLAMDELGAFTPEGFAEWVIDETHFRMGKVNRPTVSRGIGAPILQFRGFTLQSLELWTRMMVQNGAAGKTAAATSILLFMVMAGMWGFPGADDLREGAERIFKGLTGRDLDLKTKLREFVYKLTGSPLIAQMFSKGVPSGFGLDLSGRVGMGNIMPDSPLQMAGIPADIFVGRPMRFMQHASRGHWQLAWAEMMPNFVKNVLQASDWAQSGVRSAATGKVVVPAEQVTAGDVAQKAIGFTPGRISTIREAAFAKRRTESAVDELRRDYYSKLATAAAARVRAERAGKPEESEALGKEMLSLRREIAEYNRGKPPHEQVVIQPNTLRQRIFDELQGTASRSSRRRAARGRAQEINEAYGLTPKPQPDEQRQGR